MKTLKDLTCKNSVGGEIEIDGHRICNVDELRDVAIEWIKELPEVFSKKYVGDYGAEEYGSRDNIIKWIKMFFNLESDDIGMKEDLK